MVPKLFLPRPHLNILVLTLKFYFHYLSSHFCHSNLISVEKDYSLDLGLIKTFYTSLYEFLFPLSVFSWVQSFSLTHFCSSRSFLHSRSLLSWYMFCKDFVAAHYQRFLTTTTTMSEICHITTISPFFLDLCSCPHFKGEALDLFWVKFHAAWGSQENTNKIASKVGP